MKRCLDIEVKVKTFTQNIEFILSREKQNENLNL